MREHLHIWAALLVVFAVITPVCGDPGPVVSWSLTATNQITFTCTSTVIRLDVLDDHVARLRMIPSGFTFRTNESFTVVGSWPVPAWTLTSTNGLTITTAGMRIDVQTNRFRIAYSHANGDPYLTDVGSTGMSLTVSGGATQTLAYFQMPADEQYYGLGMILGKPFSYHGQVRNLWNARVAFQSGDMGDMAVPLMISSSNFGVFVDNTYSQTWDFTRSSGTRWRIATGNGEFDYYFLAGDSPADVLDHYTWLTGRAPMPPRWALGYIQSKYGYTSWTDVWNARNAFRSNDLPIDALVLDLYWFGQANQMGALTWNTTNFSNPSGNVQNLKSDGINVITIHEPYINRDNEPAKTNFVQASNLHYLVANDAAMTSPSIITNSGFWDSAGYFDFLNPAGRLWWFGKIRHLVDEGIAGHWTDLGEPEADDSTDYLFGSRHESEIHNAYSLLWHRALFEGYASNYPNQRIYLLSRSGFAGDQRYGAAHWSNDTGADWPTLLAHQNALADYGLSGLSYFGSDIGGFTGTPSDELYIRWFQFGAFCPVFRAHGMDSKPVAPYEFSRPVLDYCRNMVKLRYRLMPYIYTAARETHDKGLPMCRALPLAFPNDHTGNVTSNGSEFMFGPSILVAPIATDGFRSRWVYLPAGQWIEHVTGQLIQGPTVLTNAPAPLTDMPLYYLQDSIIPLGPIMPSTALDDGSVRSLRVYCDTQVQYWLYDDDGFSNDYLTNSFATTALAAARTGSIVTISIGGAQGYYTGMPIQRQWGVELYCTNPVFAVTAGRLALNPFLSADGLYATNSGYYVDGAARLLIVQLPPAAITQAQTVVVYFDRDAPPPYEARLNGGGDPYLDHNGLRWESDRAYSNSSFGFESGATNIIPNLIAGTVDDLLYQTEHLGATFDARFDCPTGTYEVDILNAETVWSTITQRVFNISIQNKLVFTNYDIVAAAGGGNTAVTATSTNTVTNGQLLVSFQYVKGNVSEMNARASAIRVSKIGEVDSDGDGIPDWWMRQHFGHPTGQSGDLSRATDDADGDGVNNLAEFIARTDPLSAASLLKITATEDDTGQPIVTWISVPGKHYQIIGSTNSLIWQAVADQIAPDSQTTWDAGALPDTPIFYRLGVMP